MTTSGAVSEFVVPGASVLPWAIVAGPDGALWFTDADGRVSRVTTSGTFTELTASGGPDGITVGPGGLWFVESGAGKIGMVAFG
ncbi:MAG TPA: virginiamycin B lyase, partial [Thermoanaerobaculia bacterium]|nr:virginiamycin B lyase [Thermoanaerobaculia bacterium]